MGRVVRLSGLGPPRAVLRFIAVKAFKFVRTAGQELPGITRPADSPSAHSFRPLGVHRTGGAASADPDLRWFSFVADGCLSSVCATNGPSGADLWIRTAFSTKGPFGSDTNVHLVWPLLEMNQNQREATRSRRAAGTVDVGHTPAVGEGPAASGKAGTRRLVDATCDQLWSIRTSRRSSESLSPPCTSGASATKVRRR